VANNSDVFSLSSAQVVSDAQMQRGEDGSLIVTLPDKPWSRAVEIMPDEQAKASS
jgi:hypothetical protein